MADTTTGLPVRTLAGQFVGAQIVDVGGTNIAAVSAANRLSTDLTGVGGAAVTLGQKVMASSIPVTIASDQTGFSNTQYVGDAAATATPTGTISMALANAAAPTDVSANNDAVALWALRNGSLVVNLASGGTLVTLGSKVSASSIPVVIASDQGAIPITANSSVNVAQVGGTNVVTGGVNGTLGVGGVLAHDAAAAAALPVGVGFFASAAAPSDVSADGDAVKAWALRNGSQVVNLASAGTLITIGQKAMASSLPVVLASDQSAVAVTPAANSSVNINQVVGATPSATNPLFVRLTDGTTAYSASSSAPTSPQFSTKTSALGAGSSVDLTHYVTSGKTGQLMGVDVGATVPLKVIINTEVTAVKTTRVVLFTQPFVTYQWRTPYKTFITRASADSTSGFSVTIKNLDATVAADVYSTGYWDEV